MAKYFYQPFQNINTPEYCYSVFYSIMSYITLYSIFTL